MVISRSGQQRAAMTGSTTREPSILARSLYAHRTGVTQGLGSKAVVVSLQNFTFFSFFFFDKTMLTMTREESHSREQVPRITAMV